MAYDYPNDEYWWYEKRWSVYDYDDWLDVEYFVGYCYGEHEARWFERRGYLVYEPLRRSWR